ncbi:HAD-IB family hydrolase [Oxalobacteraceae bacterium]|nr:HAD-IB family hydrolase [Oxalobacteraceae bacterium]
MSRPFERFAFFDLDGTLISDTSLLAFYRHYLSVEYPDSAEQRSADFAQALADRIASGIARDELNAWFYRNHFADLEVERIRALAQQWLAGRCADERFFKSGMVERVKAYRAQGVGTVLVTGSFREVVQPLAERFGIDACLCAPLEEVDGRYTGALTSRPMIGAGKRIAIEHFLAQHDVAPEYCSGYGDDHTDIAFLGSLGQPWALSSGTAELLAHARKSGWSVIEA